ncbi:hypothetical protein [Kibdelosporangium aridum]|uniref:hypothetical protein n=1 Tax=Kibdelosporangium aridum TaxID=2030 RepID=UPI00068A75F6
MPTNQSEADKHTPELNAPDSLGDDEAFNRLLVEMVADQAPRLFAVVIEHGHREDAAIAAWGMAFEDSAYMITADSNNHYSLSDAENALNYVRTNPNITPHLIWTSPTAANLTDTEN